MKKIYPIIFFFALASLSSCVSKKVYLEEVAKRGAAETIQAEQEKEIAELKSRIDSLNEAISAYQQDIANRDTKIRNLNTVVDTFEARNLALKQELNLLLAQSANKLQQSSAELQAKAKELARKEAIIEDLEKRIRERDEYLKNILGSIEDALKQYSTDELTIEQRDGKIYVALSNNLLFDSGKTALNNSGKVALEKLAEALKINPDISIIVEGHTDSIPIRGGAIKDNWDLSVLRATSVVRILTEDYDLPPDQITPSGKGETRPVASNSTPEGRALNRRIEIVIEPRLNEVFSIIEKTGTE